MRHFDVQLIGGMVLHGGQIAEMRTGEGKPLTATLAAYLNALPGKGVHIVMVNDYLNVTLRLTAPLFEFLGMTVGEHFFLCRSLLKEDTFTDDPTTNLVLTTGAITWRFVRKSVFSMLASSQWSMAKGLNPNR